MGKRAIRCHLHSAPTAAHASANAASPVDFDLWSGLPCPIPPS